VSTLTSAYHTALPLATRSDLLCPALPCPAALIDQLLISSAEGQPTVLDCDPSTNTCTTDIQASRERGACRVLARVLRCAMEMCSMLHIGSAAVAKA